MIFGVSIPALIAATIVPGAAANADDSGGNILTFPGFSAISEPTFSGDEILNHILTGSALDFQLELNGTWTTLSSVTTDTEDNIYNIFDEPFSFSSGMATGIQLLETP